MTRPTKSTLFLAAGIIALVLVPDVALSQLRAAPVDPIIPGLHDTGVDDGDKKLQKGDPDPHFEVISGPVTGTPTTIGPNDIPDDWINRQDSSQWISISPDTYAPAGTYVYRMEIDLTGFDPDSVVIEGIWGVDNAGAEILVNGESVALNSVGPGEYSDVVLDSGFVSGINTIDFVVPNLGDGSVAARKKPDNGGGGDGGEGGDDSLATGLRFQLSNVSVEGADLDLAIDKSHDDDFTPGGMGVFTIVVGNVGSVAADAEVVVTDTLPDGLTPTAASGTGWDCAISGQDVMCTRADALDAGDTYPPIDITVDVAADAASVTNTAFLEVDGDSNLDNNEDSDPTTIVQLVDMAILKSHEETFQQGEVGVWTIQTGNVGATPSSGTVTVQDDVPAGFTPIDASGSGWSCDIAGQSVTCSRDDALDPGEAYPPIELTVQVADDAATATNTAEVSGGGDGNEDNNTDTDTVPIEEAFRDLAIAKRHDGDFTAGDSGRTFTVTVTNTGDVASEGTVTVSDTLPTGLTPTDAAGAGWACSIAGATVTCSRDDALAAGDSYPDITITVDVADNATSTVNTATVDGGGDQNDVNNEADDPVIIDSLPDPADLAIRKRHSGSFTQGGTGTYIIDVGNVGASPTSGTVTVQDTPPDGLVPVDASGRGWACDIAGATVICTRGDALSPGDAYPPITVVVDVFLDAGRVVNTATVSGGGDDNPTNNTATDPTDVVEPFRDLAIDKSHTGTFVQGSTGTFTLVVSNVGEAPTMGTVTVSDPFPAGLQPTAASGTGWSCSISGRTVECSRDDSINPGQSFPPISVQADIAADATSVVNRATVSGGGDQEPINNTDDDAVVIEELPDPADLTINKSHTVDFEQGSTGTWNIEVTNVGESPTAGQVTVSDTVPDGFTPTNAAGNGWSCSIAGQDVTCSRGNVLAAGDSYPPITLRVAVADNATSAVNTATVDGGGDVTPGNNTDSDPIGVQVPYRDLAISKSHPAPLAAGGSGVFSITVRNVGDAASIGAVTVRDPLPAGLTPTAAEGNGWSCTISGRTIECSRSDSLAAGAAYPMIRITATAAADAVGATNVAIVNGGGDQNDVNNRAEDPYVVIIVGPTAIADLTIRKQHAGAVLDQGQQDVPFTITVTNGGGAPSSGTVTVGDDFPAGLTPTDASGAGWDCDVNGNNVTCSRDDGLAAGASYPPITVLADVGDNAASSVNIAAVAGGSDVNPSNNRGRDPVIVRSQDPDLTIAKSHSGVFRTGETGATFTVTVSNVGQAPSSGEVTVFDTLPAGLTPAAAAGPGWSCDVNGATVDCERSDALAPGAAYPPITITVDVGASATTVVNTATVAGGADVNPANNSADDRVPIISLAPGTTIDLAIDKRHDGRPEPGQSGLPVTITVSNAGSAPSNQTVTVTDPFPTGFTPTDASGNGWDCDINGVTVACSRDDALAPGSSFPPINVLVDVATDASSAINVATVEGGGDAVQENNTARDPLLVRSNDPDLTITKTHQGAFSQGQQGAAFTVLVENVGDAATEGEVTMSDTLPAGFSPIGAAGPGWSCDVSGATVTCERDDALAPGAAYPPITITVNVAGDAVDTVNTATVAGGGDAFAGNNSSDDPVAIISGGPTPIADLAIAKRHGGRVEQGQTGVTFTIDVSNRGGATSSGTVTVSDPLPAGLTPTAADGDGWSCDINGSTVTCTRGDALAAGSSYPPIIVATDVGADAQSTVNVATVSGGSDSNAGNNTARDPITIGATDPDLTITKQHDGIFQQGQRHEFLVTVRNVGTAPTAGIVTVTDTLPAGLGPADAAGDGWSCEIAGQRFTCTRADTLAVGAAWPAIMLGVNVLPTATPDTNVAVVSGGGDTTPGNNTAADAYAVGGRPDLTISKRHVGDFMQGQEGAEYEVVVRNAGNAPSSGPVTVDDIVPAGLTARGASGDGWSCTEASPSVSCTRSDVLGARRSWPAITITVDVAQDAGNLINTAVVRGGGDLTPANNVATDATMVARGPQLTITKMHPTPVVRGQNPLTFTITVANNGDTVTSGTVTVTDPVPSGLEPLSVIAEGWDCSLTAGVGTCSRDDRLAPGATYPPILFDVAVADNARSVFNRVTVAGGGDTTPEDNVAEDRVAIGKADEPNLVIDKRHEGGFQRGQSGAEFIVEVSNAGAAAGSGMVTVTDTLPASLTPTAASGSGWSCSIAGQSVSCNRGDSLAAGRSWPAITLRVNVAADAPGTIANTATVNGGGDETPEDNSDTDEVVIGASAPDLTVDKSHADPFRVDQADANYRIEVSNAGSASSSGEVTVADTITAGFRPAAASGDGWACDIAGQTVTCDRSDPLAAGASYPIITLRVDVLAGATSGTNTVVVAGGGDVNPDNNTDEDGTTVGGNRPDLTIELFAESAVVAGGETEYSAIVQNVGSGSSVGPVVVTSNLSPTVTPLLGLGSGWRCVVVRGQFVCGTREAVAPEEQLPPLRFRVAISSNPAPELFATGRVASATDSNPNNNDDELSTSIDPPAGELVITQVAAPAVVDIGGEARWVIGVRNRGSGRITDAIVEDILPRGFRFEEGSSVVVSSLTRTNFLRTSGVVLRTTDTGLQWRLGVLEPGELVLLEFATLVGADAPSGSHEANATVTGRGPGDDVVDAGPAPAAVRVASDFFTPQQVVVGRVFEDVDRDGTFGDGDRGVAGARVITSTGQAVISDPNGLYNIPSIGSGSVALSLDPGTVPEGLTLADDGPGGGSWSRLLRTPVGGGALLRQDFRLARSAQSIAASTVAATAPDSDSEGRRAPLAASPATSDKASLEGAANPGPIAPVTENDLAPSSRAAAPPAHTPTDSGAAGSQQDTDPQSVTSPLSEIDRIWPGRWPNVVGGATPDIPPRRDYESRQGPAMMIGLGEFVIGDAAPEFDLFDVDGNDDAWGYASLFYQGGFFSAENRLTFSYDSRRNINDTAGGERLFELDPLDRLYPVMGDTSIRQDLAQSNSELFFRLERGDSYVTWGDLIGDLPEGNDGGGRMAAYSRHVTGLEVRVGSEENFLAVRGANPDTSFASDVFSGSSFGLIRLSHADMLPGSETIAVEVRDRRAPERVLSRRVLARDVDYRLDPVVGALTLLTDVGGIDGNLNLVQIVATYEYFGRGVENMVYSARAAGTVGAFTLGASYFTEEPNGLDRFSVAGLTVGVALPDDGSLSIDLPYTYGTPDVSSTFNNTAGGVPGEADGFAVGVELEQPLGNDVDLRVSYLEADPDFNNPFAGTTEPGARYGRAELDLEPFDSSRLLLGITHQRNDTDSVYNQRNTASAAWTQGIADRLFLTGGYDHRDLEDYEDDTDIVSGLVTGEARLELDRFEAMVRREQNVAEESDPTYPTQTVFGARFRLTDTTSLVYSQRLSDEAIVPIGDFSGFSQLDTKREFRIGMESRLRNGARLTSRYQVEDGINGSDAFAVFGAQNRFDVGRGFGLDVGFERGQPVEGEDNAFTTGVVGLGWLRPDTFKSNMRYEMRDRNGYSGLLSGGAAGRIVSGLTGLARGQWLNNSSGRQVEGYDVLAGLALRPVASDAVGLLFSYRLTDATRPAPLLRVVQIDRRQQRLSTDAYWRPLGWFELYGKGAWQQLELVSGTTTDTYLGQGRVQIHLHRFVDTAIEQRWIHQPITDSTRNTVAAELGFWPFADLRLGVGYNFRDTTDPYGRDEQGRPKGFYFTISTKLANLFDLLGSSPTPVYEDR